MIDMLSSGLLIMVIEVSKKCSATKTYNKGRGKILFTKCSAHEKYSTTYLNSVCYFVRIAMKWTQNGETACVSVPFYFDIGSYM